MRYLPMDKASMESVPGRICNQRSAFAASQVKRGSTTMSFEPRFMQSTTQCPRLPSALAISGLLPQTKMFFGATHSGLS